MCVSLCGPLAGGDGEIRPAMGRQEANRTFRRFRGPVWRVGFLCRLDLRLIMSKQAGQTDLAAGGSERRV